MGNEIAMFREWDETKETDYFLRKYPLHDSFNRYIADLNGIYKKTPALYEKDYEPDGFEWIAINDMQGNVYGIRRNGKEKSVIAFFNFSDKARFYIYTPKRDETLRLLLHTDWDIYSGTVPFAEDPKPVKARGIGGARIDLPAFSAVLYEVSRDSKP